MDWITHFMIAFIIGRKLRLDREQMMALTLGALVLDFDVIFDLIPGAPTHGTLTHTLGGVIVLGMASTLAMQAWKGRMLGLWIGLGLASHILLDMVNTLSAFDGGKRLLYPITSSIFSLGAVTVHPLMIWAVITSALFSFSVVMLALYVYRGDAPWRVWFDERPMVAYWRERLGSRV